jgi:hypothetical protein
MAQLHGQTQPGAAHCEWESLRRQLPAAADFWLALHEIGSAEKIEIPKNKGPGRRRALCFLRVSVCFNHFTDALNGPIDLFPADSKWWGDPDYMIVSFLAEYPKLFERFTKRSSRSVEFDTDP